MSTLQTPPDGHEHSRCWCDTTYVVVPLDDIREGRTRPCRKKTCKP